MKQLDILTIGDIATDIFIKIKEAEAVCDPDGNDCKLCLDFGAKIPYESVETCHAVGNSSNAAISASRLGLKSGLMTSMGDDQNGFDCLKVLEEEGVDLNFIKKEKDKITSNHYVLWYKGERTILTKHEKYNYEWTKTKESEDYQTPSWIYLSSLGENSISFVEEILKYLDRHTHVKLAFQPGTLQIKQGYEKLKEIYKKADIFLCNKEEAEKILNTNNEEISKILKGVFGLGPKLVVITDGAQGAYVYDGNKVWFIRAFETKPIESTGAGDAFSSTFVSAILLGKNISEALIWASVNAASVISFTGPHKGLLNKNQIEDYIKNIPDDYKPTIIS